MTKRTCLMALAACGWVFSALAQAQTVDVSGQVTVSYSGYVLNRADGTFDTQATLINSLIPIQAPVQLVISSLPTGVTLANATGVTASGSPYLTVNVTGGALLPGAGAIAILRFINPSRTPILFTTQILAAVLPQTSSTSVLAAVDSTGSTLALPGVATLRVPAGAVNTAAIQLSTTTVTNLVDLVTETLPGFAVVSAPALHIKSSSTLQGPVYLQQTIPGLSAQVADGSSPSFIAVSLEQEDDASYTDIRSIGGALCALDTICAMVPIYAFNPVSSDPNDPDLVLAVANGPAPSEAHTALWRLNSQNTTIASANATSVEFDAELLFAPDFNFLAASPLSSISITSAFKALRALPGMTARPHRAVDLGALVDTPIYSPLPGTLGPYLQQERGPAPPCTPPVGPIYHDYVYHQESLETRYLHLDPTSPPQPNQVTAAAAISTPGTAFAVTGTSGACKPDPQGRRDSQGKLLHVPAPHLHFELLMNRTQIDPRPLLPMVNLGMYLLPPDPADGLAGNLASSRMYVLLFVDGLPQDPSLSVGQEQGELRFPSLYTTSGSMVNNQRELQTITITPVLPTSQTSSYLTLANGTADLFYRSGPVNLANMVAAAAGGTDPTSFVRQHKVEVRLIVDNFRFGRIYQVATWRVLTVGLQSIGVGASAPASSAAVPSCGYPTDSSSSTQATGSLTVNGTYVCSMPANNPYGLAAFSWNSSGSATIQWTADPLVPSIHVTMAATDSITNAQGILYNDPHSSTPQLYASGSATYLVSLSEPAKVSLTAVATGSVVTSTSGPAPRVTDPNIAAFEGPILVGHDFFSNGEIVLFWPLPNGGPISVFNNHQPVQLPAGQYTFTFYFGGLPSCPLGRAVAPADYLYTVASCAFVNGHYTISYDETIGLAFSAP